jgi:hypothetical protein
MTIAQARAPKSEGATGGAASTAQWTCNVTLAPRAETVAGAAIDRPETDQRGDGWSLLVAGWVVGQFSPAHEIQVLCDGMLVRRTRVDLARGDVAAMFPETPGADRSGFRIHLGLIGLPPNAQLEVVVRLADETAVHFATIFVRHGPLTTPYRPRLSPLLVTSLGRMGTTWMMRLLAHHPEVVVHPQYPYEFGMARYWAHLLRVACDPADHLDSSEPEGFTAELGHIGHNPYFGDFLIESPSLNHWLDTRHPTLLGACALQSLDEFYLGPVAGMAGMAQPRFFAEKGLPDHVPDVLGNLYPEAREIFLVRDIRDVICSAIAFDCKRGRPSFGRESLDDHLGFVSQLRVDLGRLVDSWQRRRGEGLLVHYETLVTAPEHTLGQILGHLGLADTPDVVATVLEGASSTTPELDGHRTTANPAASIGRWRTDLAKVHPDLPDHCAILFAPLLDQLGYSVAPLRARRMERTLTDVLGRLDGSESGPDA